MSREDDDDDRPRRKRDDNEGFEERRPRGGRDDPDDDDRPRRRSRSDRDDDDDDDRRRRRRYRDDDDDDDYRRRTDIGQDAGIRMLLPVGRSGWAIAAGYLGLLSLLCVPGPFAVLCGIMAIMEMKRDSKKHGMGRAIFGIVMGSLGSIVLAIALISLLAGNRR